jgi:Fic family protein
LSQKYNNEKEHPGWVIAFFAEKCNNFFVTEAKYNKALFGTNSHAMRNQDFTDNKPGRLITPIGESYWAFVPNPLPPDIRLSWELVKQLSEADRALSELAGIARTLPNPHLLIDPFIRQEAVFSSRIEGTETSLSELFVFEASGIDEQEASDTKRADVREVINYVAALNFGLKRLQEVSITLRLMREMHEILMHGVRGQSKSPGEFRREQNWIGPRHCSLDKATYVPPPPTQMLDTLYALENYINSPSPLPPLICMALIHYQFEAIHPFLDGNGRIGRLLIILMLCSKQLLSKPLLYLSGYFDRNKDEYLDLLLAVSQKGAWLEWVVFFLKGVAEQSKDAIQRSDRLLILQQDYRHRLQSVRASSLALQLIDDLFAYPAISITRTARRLHRTPHAIQDNVDKLIGLKILTEATGRERNRVFVAPEIIRIIEV